MKQFHPCFYPPLSKFSVTYTTSLLLNTNFHSHKTSPVTAAFLQANSVYIPFFVTSMGNRQKYLPHNSGWAPQQLTYDICGPNRASGICVQTIALKQHLHHRRGSSQRRESLQSRTQRRSLQRLIKLHKLSSFRLVSVVAGKAKTSTPACHYDAPASNQSCNSTRILN